MAEFDLEIEELNAATLETFGDDVLYIPPGGTVDDSYEVPVVLDFSETARARDKGIAGTAFARASDFVDAPVRNSTIEAKGIVYRVANDPADERDGQGGLTLHLRKK